MIQNLTESRIRILVYSSIATNLILLQKVSDSSFFLFELNYLSTPYYVTASLAKSEDHIATYIGITFLTLLTLGLKKNAVCKIFLICIGILLSMTYIFMQLAANNIGFTRYSYTIYNRMVAFQNEKAKTRLFPLLIAAILTFKQKKLIFHPITKET